MEKRYWVIYFQGASAVKAGYAYQQNHCYRRILHDGEYAGQLEVVRDDEDAQLVAVNFIPEKHVGFVKEELSKNGFAGMEYVSESYSDEECMWGYKEEEKRTMPENPDTVYKTFLCGKREPLPEPTPTKSVITISAKVYEEQGEWIDWCIDCDDPGIFLPDDEKDCAKYLRKFDIILVGDKWFRGEDAEKAMNECYRQYRKITIVDDKDKIVAEIYDRQTMYDCTEDLGRYRWQSQNFGNIERSFADVLECAEDGDTYKHNYKGW